MNDVGYAVIIAYPDTDTDGELDKVAYASVIKNASRIKCIVDITVYYFIGCSILVKHKNLLHDRFSGLLCADDHSVKV